MRQLFPHSSIRPFSYFHIPTLHSPPVGDSPNPSKTTLRLTAIILNHGSSRKPRSRTRKRLEKEDLRNSQTTNMPLQPCDRFEHFSPRASYLRSRGCSLTPAKSSNRSRWVFENRVPCLSVSSVVKKPPPAPPARGKKVRPQFSEFQLSDRRRSSPGAQACGPWP